MDVIKRLWDVYALKLLFEIQSEISLFRIEGGKIEVNWDSFIKLEDQVTQGQAIQIDVPKEIQEHFLKLYCRIISLLEILQILEINKKDKKVCYEIHGKLNGENEEDEEEDPEISYELAIHVPNEIETRGFTRESDAKKYLLLKRSYLPKNCEWEIIPPEEPLNPEEKVLLEKKREEQQMRKAELLFRTKIAEIVNFFEGKATINFQALFEFEELISNANGDEPIFIEVQSRIWDRLQMMDIVSDDPNGNWLILSEDTTRMYNPRVFGQPKYFRRYEDAAEWRKILIQRYPDLVKVRIGRIGTIGAKVQINLKS